MDNGGWGSGLHVGKYFISNALEMTEDIMTKEKKVEDLIIIQTPVNDVKIYRKLKRDEIEKLFDEFLKTI